MKRLLIGSCLVIALAGTAPAMADDHRGYGHSPGIEKHQDRDKPFLKAHYRRDDHKRRYEHKPKHRHHKRRADHFRHYDRGYDHRKRNQHSYQRRHYRERYDGRHDRHHDHRRGYRIHLGFDDHVPPEYRVARIIRDTRELIEPSHR